MDKKMEINANALGIDNILWQTQEECAELIQAISKYNRARGMGAPTPRTLEETIENLKLEIADVEICITEIKHLLHLETSKIIDNQVDIVYNRLKDKNII